MSIKRNIPRLVIAALKGGAGKTFLSVGIAAALRKRNLSPAVFKKGPDYIDSAWLGRAAWSQCHNLDAYLFDTDTLVASFVRRSIGSRIAVVEGNRGLFDGVDAAGTYSTAELAKLLKAPVILVVDATKTTRTAAALVMGCRCLDPELDLRAVILNRVAGARHEKVLRESIEDAAGVPVIGSVRKLSLESFPQRHLGLLSLYEHPEAAEFISEAADVVERSVDLERVLTIASDAAELTPEPGPVMRESRSTAHKDLRIGVLKDSAFQFYYPENLEALGQSGARLVEISALEPKTFPDVDALYIGGGFPETHAERLAENSVFKESLRTAISQGLPVYAECGGLMYLSRNLRIDEQTFPMLGVFSVDSVLEPNPQGHGYITVEVIAANPFFPQGTVLTGHEFHYSHVVGMGDGEETYAFRVLRGHGMGGDADGMCTRNVLGTYVHVHALGAPQWADGILSRAAGFHARRPLVAARA